MKMGFLVYELGFRPKLAWELGFGPKLGWELGFRTPLQDPLKTTMEKQKELSSPNKIVMHCKM